MDKILCLITTTWSDYDEQDIWMDLEPTNRHSIKTEKVTPLYNHPHSDIENGQKEVHYHIDSRYDEFRSVGQIRVSLPLKQNEKLEYRYLKKYHEREMLKTPVQLIRKSKLKHNCIHKGKCPHID